MKVMLSKDSALISRSHTGMVINARRIPLFCITAIPQAMTNFFYYRSLVPLASQCTNLIVTVCTSATHIGYGPIRLEPQFMIMGQSGGVAAAQAIAQGVSVQSIDIPTLQKRLVALGQKIDL